MFLFATNITTKLSMTTPPFNHLLCRGSRFFGLKPVQSIFEACQVGCSENFEVKSYPSFIESFQNFLTLRKFVILTD